MDKKFLERFWGKVAVGDDAQCWEWKAAKDRRGYGAIKMPNQIKVLKAHRVSYEISHGPLPSEVFVLHSCDNPACVNPHHLRAGDHQENMRDMFSRRRNSPPPKLSGPKNGFSRLTELQVQRARIANGAISQSRIAKIMGVSTPAIGGACRRTNWGHLGSKQALM